MSFTDVKQEDLRPRKLPEVPPGDEIVISGIAGRFPESDNVKQLKENLMNKRDLITGDDRRWKLGKFRCYFFLPIVYRSFILILIMFDRYIIHCKFYR